MSNRTNGQVVRQLEEAFAQYVGAKYAIACCNGTATLHTALVALGVKPGDRVAVPPLTMASTTLAVLHAGAAPVFCDVDARTWLLNPKCLRFVPDYGMIVSLYGLGVNRTATHGSVIDDAAQTLNKHNGCAFTSYSFQASKILSAGEGGMLVTDDFELAGRAQQFRNLGYPSLGEKLIATLKSPNAVRHLVIGYNYRMADCQVALLLPQLERADEILAARSYSAHCYRQAHGGCSWLTAQYVPGGWPHSYWTYALAADTREHADSLQEAIVQAGGERCYRAWRITYQEPAFRHLAPDGTCPMAEDLQPRLMQLQTNHDKLGAERAAEFLRKAIQACAF